MVSANHIITILYDSNALFRIISLCRYFWTALSSVKSSPFWSIAFIKKKDVLGKTSLENER